MSNDTTFPASVIDAVHVDRSVRPTYPSFIRRYTDTPEFIRLEATGPSDYSLDLLELSFHPKQVGCVATGCEVYEHQKVLGLHGCLGLADLLAIQALGVEAFRCHWKGKAVFGWRSAARDGDDDLHAPYLLEDGDRQVALRWYWLDNNQFSNDPALRFPE